MFSAGIGAVCATILVSAGLLAQDNPYGEMSPQQQKKMAAWMKYMTPGEHHQKLMAKAGDWTVEGKMIETPGGEPDLFNGTANLTEIMGGRFILETFKGDFRGQPFEGMGVFGYDNLTDNYTGIWLDNMGTGIMTSEGTPSGDDTIHYMMQQPDFINGVYTQGRIVEKQVSPNKLVSSFYNTTPEGEEYMHMELTYVRALKKKKKGY